MSKLKRFLIKWFVTSSYLGLLPGAPGTFGTFAGLVIYIFISPYSHIYWAVTSVIIVLGVWGSGFAEKAIFKTKDSSEIVIDEVAGYLVSMAFFDISDGYIYALLGFGFFRLFDILKPWPINNLQKLPGGWGIMMDDIMAGIYSNIILLAIFHLVKYYQL